MSAPCPCGEVHEAGDRWDPADIAVHSLLRAGEILHGRGFWWVRVAVVAAVALWLMLGVPWPS